MQWIKSTVDKEVFKSGRQVRNAIYYADVSDPTMVGKVDDDKIKATDVVITELEYDTIHAQIRAYNDALPPESEPEQTRHQVLQASLKVEPRPTDDEADTIIREMLRIERGL